MFATLSRFRRHVAVLSVLALMASVLVAVPVVAADAKPSYTASFDACAGAPSSGFEDVPASHANAGDIDCIAYYGITKGTSATSYSPRMAVTREHMALFLTRLAGLVGIEMASDPSDPGFADIGELSAESQTAIAQLADLGITKGTSVTTYSPADNVKRGHMALFIARLMNKMDTITDADGHTPSEVAADENDVGDKNIGSPFTDLGSATKDAYDAITQLYELGVATGVSAVNYSPESDITRAAMAGFMAAVLDHSNTRPSGLTIQASKTSGYGTVTATVMVSYRDDSFMPVVDQAIDLFNSEAADGGLDRHGACVTDPATAVNGDCTWDDSDELTDKDGNIPDPGVSVGDGDSAVYYAWIGTESGDKFDRDDVDYVSVSITSMNDEGSVMVDNGINDRADTTSDSGEDFTNVHLGATSSVTITLQLKSGATGAGSKVARSGVKFTVDTNLGGKQTDEAAVIETDENGEATYTVTGPTDDKSNTAQQRFDTIEFTYKGTDTTVTTDDVNGFTAIDPVRIAWIETLREAADAVGQADAYVVTGTSGRGTVSATVTLYDQYGDSIRTSSGQQATITIGGTDVTVNVNHRGVARASRALTGLSAGTDVDVAYDVDPTETPEDIDLSALTNPETSEVEVVGDAGISDTGSKSVHTFFAKEDRFTTESAAPARANLLYSYDSGDTFLSGASAASRTAITMEKFEELLAQPATGANGATVDVISYSDTGGSSIFVVTAKADGTAP